MTSLKAKSYIGKLVLEHRTSSCPGDYLLSLPRWGRFNAFAQCISAVVRRVLHHPRDVLIALSDPRPPPPPPNSKPARRRLRIVDPDHGRDQEHLN